MILPPNKALHLTAIPLRSIATGELHGYLLASFTTLNNQTWQKGVHLDPRGDYLEISLKE
jgi:hypothetical protein